MYPGIADRMQKEITALLHPPSRSRSLLHQRGSTLSGSEDPSSLPSPPSSRCGSPSRSMTSAAHPLFTASASKLNLSNEKNCTTFLLKIISRHNVVLVI